MILTKKFLFLLIIGSLFFVVVKFYSFYSEYSNWQYADWLINYQGGFVRRGFIGEILFRIHKISLINLDLLILIFVIFLYSIFSYFLLKSVKYLKSSYENLLIILSPGFFLYPVMNSEIVGRKDILLISVFSSLVFLERKIHHKLLLPIFIIAIVTISLSHSAFVFYIPYFLILYILVKSNRRLIFNLFDLFTFVVISVALIFLIQFFNGSQMHIEKICESVINFASNNCGSNDQIAFLNFNLQTYLLEKPSRIYLKSYLFIYVLSVFLVFLFISLKLLNSRYTSKFISFKKFNPFLIICLLFLFTLPTYILGLDWGRYIYISFSITYFLYIYCLKNNVLNFYEIKFFNLKNFNKISLAIFIFFYSFFWTFPFYIEQSTTDYVKNFKLIFSKPLKSIIRKIN